MKSKVLGRKGILVSDPVVGQMNPTQWVWEAESVRIAEEDRVEELKAIFKIVKATTIKLLGLNICPIEEEDGRLRPPEDTEIIPLSIWCGSEAILGDALKRNKELVEQEAVESEIGEELASAANEMTADEFDAMMNTMGDIEFDTDSEMFKRPEWESEEAKTMRKQLVETVGIPGVNRKSRVTIEEIDEADMPALRKSTSLVVESVEDE